jgi:hypothetical protein
VAAPSAPYISRPAPIPTPATPGPTSTAMRLNATQALGSAKSQNRDAVYRALMQLGDTSQFGKYQADPNFAGYQFTQDPNSVFATLARQQTKGLQDIDLGTLGGNTFFSSNRLQGRQDLTDETGRQQLAGTTSFLDDLKSYAASLGVSERDFNQAMADADQADIDAALAQDRLNRDDPTAPAPAAPAAPVAAPTAQPAGPTTTTQVKPQLGNNPGVYVQNQGTRAGLQYIIKNGVKWYESKKGKGDWGKGGKIGMTP